MKKFRKNNKGFTLVELIIVIAIIAVLSAVAAPQYLKYVDKSKAAADEDLIARVYSAAQVALVDADYDLKDNDKITIDDTGITLTVGTGSEIEAAMEAYFGLDFADATHKCTAEKLQKYTKAEFTFTVTGTPKVAKAVTTGA